jgi:hypothetical protein
MLRERYKKPNQSVPNNTGNLESRSKRSKNLKSSEKTTEIRSGRRAVTRGYSNNKEATNALSELAKNPATSSGERSRNISKSKNRNSKTGTSLMDRFSLTQPVST